MKKAVIKLKTKLIIKLKSRNQYHEIKDETFITLTTNAIKTILKQKTTKSNSINNRI